MGNLELRIEEYTDPNIIHCQYVINILNSKSHLTVTKDIIGSKGVLLAKKGFVLTEEQKRRLVEERNSTVDEHISISDQINLEKIFEYVTNVSQKLSTIGYNFNKEVELIDSIISQIDLNSKLEANLTIFRNNSPSKFDETILIAFLSTIIKKSFENNKKSLTEIFTSALFHRIGELYLEPIPETGNITQDELSRIYAIPLVSHLMLKHSQTQFSENILDTILSQSEFLDGSGYPRKLFANQIQQDAKILNLVKTYNALLRKGNTNINAIQIIHSLSYSSVDDKGKLIMPKYDSKYIESLKKQNLETIISNEKINANFNQLIEDLKTEFESTYAYFELLNNALKTDIFLSSSKLMELKSNMQYNLELLTTCGILTSEKKISSEFFTSKIIDLDSYSDIQNIVLPKIVESLQAINYKLINNDSQFKVPIYYTNRAQSHIEEFSSLINRYHSLN